MIDGMDTIDKWYLARWSKFTSSEKYKLLTPAKPNQFWSEGAKAYIEEKANQSVSEMWERPELEEVKSLLWGKVHEYPGYEDFVRQTKNYSMTYLGSENPIFLEYEPFKDECGGTPDIVNITESGSIDAGCELKCPRNPVLHFRRLSWVSQWDVKENYPLVYTQIQSHLMITGALVWYFSSFDDRQILKSKKSKIIEIKPDKTFQDNLHVKIEMAIKEKYKLISKHLDEDVKCKQDFLNLKIR